jgi:hypothetical protein
VKSENAIFLLIVGVGAIAAYYLIIKPAAAASAGLSTAAAGAGNLAGGVGNVVGSVGTGLSLLVSPSTWNTLLARPTENTVAGIDTNVADASGANGQTADSAAHSAAIIAGTAPYTPYVPPTTQPAGTLTGGASGADQ